LNRSFFLFLIAGLLIGYVVFWLCTRLGTTFKFYPQRIREFYEDQSKANVPLSGGIGFLLFASVLFFVFHEPALLIGVLAGLVGFIDDFTKIRRRGNGIKARVKIALLFLVSLTLFFYGFGWQRVLWSFIVLLAATSATNFTDGVDGLLGAVLIPVFLVLPSSGVTGALLGALLSFLVFNSYPAKLFMGDTGSFFFGGYLGALMLLQGREWWLLLVCFIGVVEVLSVMIQVSYFRLTGGKRVFLMTPIHHHFQKLGWSDPRIVTLFASIQALACAVCWVGWNAWWI
jgi:phospho-N-acetylmuramoyl-pentapeptide-transferase